MEFILYIILGIILGTIIGWFFAKNQSGKELHQQQITLQSQIAALDKSFGEYKARCTEQLENASVLLESKMEENKSQQQIIETNKGELSLQKERLSEANAELRSKTETIGEKNELLQSNKEELATLKNQYDAAKNKLATADAGNTALIEKLQTQKDEMGELNKKFNTEFENIANKILETKTEKFTELNKNNLSLILEPLSKNLTEFKSKVEEVYDKEAKERFSLGEKVKELAQLNKVISEEAHNLTKALKNESKIQGGWGEMILENILEKSGLVKNREYFMEHELRDENGNPLRSDEEGKKMRPDAVIKYPDNRNVIIDSKVSLNAFTRCIEAMDETTRNNELSAHLACIRKHITTLSAKGYDDYDKSLDFVMMFIPSEPAYIAVLQIDPDLWEFAYNKRILLLSPTNLITSLKLIVDLWKREYQNQNALDIAERGAKLYDKFVGFVANLTDVGKHLQSAQEKYGEAYKQLSTGNDNLVIQATKLKALGLKAKKELPKDIVTMSISAEQIESGAEEN